MGLIQDLRFATRSLRRRPGFTFVAVLTIGLGVGATSAIFSVVDTAVLQPLAFERPDELVDMWTQFEPQGDDPFGMSDAEFFDYRERQTSFSSMGAYVQGGATLTGIDQAVRVRVALTSWDFFPTLSLGTERGRLPSPADARPGIAPIVLISHGFWVNQLGGTPNVVGQTVRLDGNALEIIGVLQPDSELPTGTADVWVVHQIDRPSISDRSGHYLRVVGRLQEGSSLELARSEMRTIEAEWSTRFAGQHTPGAGGHSLAMSSLDDRILGGFRQLGWTLLGTVGLVLLLACANVASLLLARGEARWGEMGVRTALGAGKARIAKQLLTESVVLSLIGATLGLALATFGTDALLRLAPAAIPRADGIGLNGRVLIFTLVTAGATGVLFGVAPILQTWSTNVGTLLRSGGRARTKGARKSLGTLVLAQVALATLILVGAGLLGRTVQSLANVDPGFQTDQRMVFDIALPDTRYSDIPSMVQFYDELDRGLSALPGVRTAAYVRLLPLRQQSRSEGVVVESRVGDEDDGVVPSDYQTVSAGYFEAMEIRVVQGRTFSDADRDGTPLVALVNETAASNMWPNGDAVGQRIRALFGPEDHPWITVIGVVGDVHQNDLTSPPRSEVYLPYVQAPPRGIGYLRQATFVVDGAAMSELADAVRGVVAQLDPDVPVQRVEMLRDVSLSAARGQRFMATLLGIFALLALSIAAVGIYGTVAFSVARRTREFGVRLALGEGQTGLLGSVLRGGVLTALGGVLLGLVAAVVLAPSLEAFLFGVQPWDAVTFLVVPLVLLGAAALASYIPAVRASRVHPVDSLRSEA